MLPYLPSLNKQRSSPSLLRSNLHLGEIFRFETLFIAVALAQDLGLRERGPGSLPRVLSRYKSGPLSHPRGLFPLPPRCHSHADSVTGRSGGGSLGLGRARGGGGTHLSLSHLVAVTGHGAGKRRYKNQPMTPSGSCQLVQSAPCPDGPLGVRLEPGGREELPSSLKKGLCLSRGTGTPLVPSALRGREVAQGQRRPKPGLLQALGLSTTSCGSIAHPRLPSPIPWGKQRPSWGLGQALWSSSATYGQT